MNLSLPVMAHLLRRTSGPTAVPKGDSTWEPNRLVIRRVERPSSTRQLLCYEGGTGRISGVHQKIFYFNHTGKQRMEPHKRRIFCVDDEVDTCSMIRSLLALVQCHVEAAHTFGQAWQRIQAEPFDLYLLDNWLPGGSGVELCRKIRAVDKETPIIFYTGAAYDSDRQEAMAAGAQVYLVKPSDIDKLVEVVRQLLGLSTERTQPLKT